jgi:hypothetical protein
VGQSVHVEFSFSIFETLRRLMDERVVR